MKIIIETDGVLCDIRPAWWQAYSDAVRSIGLARCDEETFWRLVRSGADDGQLVRGARPRQLESFRTALNESLEAEATLALIRPHEEAARIVAGLSATFEVVPFTFGANVAGRRGLLGRLGFSNGVELVGLPVGPAPARSAAMSALATVDAPGRPPVVLGSSEAAMRAADDAGLTPLGIASGAAIGRRLEAAGARVVYPELALFDEARRSGDGQLVRLGVVVQSARFGSVLGPQGGGAVKGPQGGPLPGSAESSPRRPPTPHERAADRIRRHRDRGG